MRPFLACALPTLLALAWIILPLVRGSDTLYLRDVFSTHLPLKAAQAEAMHEGRFPLIDPHRDGGQPLAGNPNAVAFYPDNLLYLVAGGNPFDTLWALNAHFWLHWLLAVPAMFWLGRALGMSRPAAWATGVLWATGGYFLSQLSFYNLIAGVTLTPAFLAAWLHAGRHRARRSLALAAVALLWALLLVSGDPLIAALALAIALSAWWVRPDSTRAETGGTVAPGSFRRSLLPLAAALVVGTLIAAPQWVEFLRVLAGSFRALYGYSHAGALAASIDPRQLLDLLLPLPFGRPDQLGAQGFWGQRFHGGTLPYYWSLYPGLAGLALAGAAGWPRWRRAQSAGAGAKGMASSENPRVKLWCWLLIVGSLFVALGRFNPLASWLYALPGLRYPVKMILPAVLGLTLLAGLGFDAALVRQEPTARRRFGWALGALALGLATVAVGVIFFPRLAESTLAGWIQEGQGRIDAADARLIAMAQLARWAQTAAWSLAVAAALGLAFRWSRAKPALGVALFLAVHTVGQWFFLYPLAPTDAALPYRLVPALLAEIGPPDAGPGLRLVHGASGRLFGPSQLYAGRFPDNDAHWPARRAFHEIYPLGAALWHRNYSLDLSPEGLSSFETTIAREAVEASPDEARLRLLAAWGVDRLLLDRPLAPAAAGLAEPIVEWPSFGGLVRVYAVNNPAPPARLAQRVVLVDGPQEAFEALTAPGFDPRTTVAVQGPLSENFPPAPESDPVLTPVPAPVAASAPATTELQVLEDTAEHFAARVESPGPSVLALRRSYLTLYRASVGGEPAAVRRVNMHQLGVEVPAGNHEVRLWIDRRPLRRAIWASLLGLCGLVALVARQYRR